MSNDEEGHAELSTSDASAWSDELGAAMRWPRPPLLISPRFHYGPAKLYRRLQHTRSLILVSSAFRFGSFLIPVGVLALLSTVLGSGVAPSIEIPTGRVSAAVLLVVGVTLVWFTLAALVSFLWVGNVGPDVEQATVTVLREMYQEAGGYSPDLASQAPSPLGVSLAASFEIIR